MNNLYTLDIILSKVKIFDIFNVDEINSIIFDIEYMQFNPNDVVFSINSQINSLFIVKSGEYIIRRISKDNPVDDEVHNDVNVYGTEGMIENKAFTYSLIALSKCIICKYERSKFLEVYRKKQLLDDKFIIDTFHLFSKQHCVEDSVLLEQGKPADGIYFILKGDAIITHNVVIANNTYPDVTLHITTTGSCYGLTSLLGLLCSIERFNMEYTVSIKRGTEYLFFNKSNFVKLPEEVINNIQKYAPTLPDYTKQIENLVKLKQDEEKRESTKKILEEPEKRYNKLFSNNNSGNKSEKNSKMYNPNSFNGVDGLSYIPAFDKQFNPHSKINNINKLRPRTAKLSSSYKTQQYSNFRPLSYFPLVEPTLKYKYCQEIEDDEDNIDDSNASDIAQFFNKEFVKLKQSDSLYTYPWFGLSKNNDAMNEFIFKNSKDANINKVPGFLLVTNLSNRIPSSMVINTFYSILPKVLTVDLKKWKLIESYHPINGFSIYVKIPLLIIAEAIFLFLSSPSHNSALTPFTITMCSELDYLRAQTIRSSNLLTIRPRPPKKCLSKASRLNQPLIPFLKLKSESQYRKEYYQTLQGEKQQVENSDEYNFIT